MKHPFLSYRSVLLALALGAVYTGASGQRARPAVLAYGIHAGISMQSFSLESDVPALQGLGIPADGVTGGFDISVGRIGTTVSLTRYVTNPASAERVDKNSFQATVRYYAGQSQMIRPFVMAGLNSSSLYFRSVASLPAAHVSPTETDACDDSSGGGPMGKPGADEGMDSPSTDAVSVEQHVRLTGLQGVGGAGIELNFANHGQYIKLFSSVAFGIPIHHTTSSPALSNTTVAGQFLVNFGVGIGLQR